MFYDHVQRINTPSQTKFRDLLKSANINVNYEDLSYDLESLFTSIPVAETIEYILKRIYTNKELKHLSNSLSLKIY